MIELTVWLSQGQSYRAEPCEEASFLLPLLADFSFGFLFNGTVEKKSVGITNCLRRSSMVRAALPRTFFVDTQNLLR